MKGAKREIEQLLEGDPDDPGVFEDEDNAEEDEHDLGDMELDHDEDKGYGVGDVISDVDEEDNDTKEIIGNPPTRRLKRKTKAADLPDGPYNAMMLKTDLTRRGVERKEKELPWSEIPDEMKNDFRAAEVIQWNEHLSFDALAPLSTEQSDRRREGDQVPWKCKSRLVIAGHTDPDLGVEALSTDAPALSCLSSGSPNLAVKACRIAMYSVLVIGLARSRTSFVASASACRSTPEIAVFQATTTPAA